MWVFTRYGFFSATCARRDEGDGPVDPDRIMVRARERDHLTLLMGRFAEALGEPEIMETPEADYRFRIIVAKSAWSEVARDLALDTDYDNFKNHCHDRAQEVGSGYVSALHDVWGTMHALQERGE